MCLQELSAYEVLQDFSDTADDEIRDFLQMVARYLTNIPASASSSSSSSSLLLMVSFPVAEHRRCLAHTKLLHSEEAGVC